MTRKFSDITIDGGIGIINLIESKINNFKARLNGNQDAIGEQFSNAFNYLPMQRLNNLDSIIHNIIQLIRDNSNVEMDDICGSLWQDVSSKYGNIYLTIKSFNESGPGVNEIMNSREWQDFITGTERQLHEYDNYQNRISGKFEKLQDLETRTYTLLSLIKSAIIESRGVPKKFEIPEGFEEAKKIADSLVENSGLIESGIQSSKSIQAFNTNNIDQALQNVGEMFYNKDAYLVFRNSKISFSDIIKKSKENLLESLFLMINEFFDSPKWWLLAGLIPLVLLFGILWNEYLVIIDGKLADLQKYKDFWQIIVSLHLIGTSFLGYITVFCFSNFRKLEQRHEAYKFRGVLTRSFGFLLKTATDEQQKILYPKALDAIFKDLPESHSGQQDLNINLPVTEIMKGISGK